MDHTPDTPPRVGGQEHAPDMIETVRHKVIRRTCEWCGTEIALRRRGKGRPRTYCSRSCRQRAYEVRTARQRQARDQDAGRARRDDEPVREVVERTTVRTRMARSPVQSPGVYPGDLHPQGQAQEEERVRPREVQRLLTRVAAEIAQGQMSPREVERIMRAVEAVRTAGDRWQQRYGTSGRR